jgi:hypothetical protein
MSVNVIKGFFYPVLEFRFQQVPAIPLRVSERLGQKIRGSAGPSWPVRDSESLKLGSESGAPRAKACGPSTCFRGRNPPKHTLLRSFGASKGTLSAFTTV